MIKEEVIGVEDMVKVKFMRELLFQMSFQMVNYFLDHEQNSGGNWAESNLTCP